MKETTATRRTALTSIAACRQCPVLKSTLYFSPELQNQDEIRRLRREVRCSKPRSTLYAAGKETREVATLAEGWAFRYRLLADGRRVVLGFLLPGDSVNAAALANGPSNYSVEALTETTLCVFDRDELSRYLMNDGRLARQAWSRCLYDTEGLRDRLCDLQTRNARRRVAALLVRLQARLAARGLVSNGSFDFPPRQHHLADALGLTRIHISRTFGQLENDRLVLRNGRRLRIPDLQNLRAAARI